MLLGHADTVYPPGTQPVHFIREGDYAKGPGVMDMKGGLVTMVWALQALSAAQKLSRIPVVLLSNCDEETGSTAFRERIEAEARAACAVLVFEPGRPQDGIVTQRKGVASWKVIATGKASHAGNAHQAGQNAITALARVITAVEALTNYEKGLTFNVGLISGGTAVNTVPEQAVAHFDVRCIDTEDYVAVRRHILSWAGKDQITGATIRLEEYHHWPPLQETSASQALFESYRKFAAEAGCPTSAFQQS
ncbi:MAG: M20/M25/M40 family metallo-hydrolase [Proteobacteria bacterium]|nr:M20/M25/M40 family metallo-hydrolase [Pseudomonadota bacterium]